MANREEILYERNEYVKDMDYDIYGFALTRISNIVTDIKGSDSPIRTCLYFQVKDPKKNIDNAYGGRSYYVLESKPIGAAERYFKNINIVDAIKIVLSMHPENSLKVFQQIPTGIFEDNRKLSPHRNGIPYAP